MSLTISGNSSLENINQIPVKDDSINKETAPTDNKETAPTDKKVIEAVSNGISPEDKIERKKINGPVKAALPDETRYKKIQKAFKNNSLSESQTRKVSFPLDTILEDGKFPFHHAILNNDLEAIEFLLDKTDLQKKDKNGFNAFDYALQSNNMALAERIIKKQIEKDWDQIKKTCGEVEQKEKQVLGKLVKNGARPIWRFSENHPRLVEFIRHGYPHVIGELILHSTSLFTIDSWTKKTLLHIAVEEGREDVAFFLLRNLNEKAQNPESYLAIKDVEGYTAEEIAQKKGFLTIQRLFSEFRSKELSKETNDMFRKLLPEIQEFSDKYNNIQAQKETASRGYHGHNWLLVNAIENLNFKAFLRFWMDGADILTLDLDKKETLLHLAVKAGQKEIVFFLLDSPLNSQIKNVEGLTALDLAKKANNADLVDLLTSFLDTTQKPSAESMKKQEDLKKIVTDYIESYKNYLETGKNGLLIKAIETYDFRAFLRLFMDGADILTINPKTKETLLHLAVKAGQKEIVYFLLTTPLDPQLKNSEGITALDLAKTANNAELVDLITSILNTSEKPLPESIKKQEDLKKILIDYMQSYINGQGELSEYEIEYRNETKQRYDIAKHGSEGHNSGVLACVIQNNLENLIEWAQWGADLGTISVPHYLMFEDPMGWKAQIKKNYPYGEDILKEDETVIDKIHNGLEKINETLILGKKLGKSGKSLLDIAVISTKEGQDNIEIIAYLLSKGLDPFKVNDERETPLSMALLKGNLKAASLMMNYQAFSEGKNLSIDEKSWERALVWLKEGSKQRDPLNVSFSSLAKAGIAGTLLLSPLIFGQSTFMNVMQIFPLVFGGLIYMPSFREELIQKTIASSMPKIVQQAESWIGRASILEIAVVPGTPLATLTSTAIHLASTVSSVFSTLKNVVAYGTARPLKAAYKLGVEGIPVVHYGYRFRDLFSAMFFRPSVAPICEKISPEGYRNNNDIFKLVGDKKLKPECIEHAKIMLNPNWDKDPKNQNIGKLFRQGARKLHPDKGGDGDLFRKFKEAKITLMQDAEKPTYLSQAPRFVLETAAKAGIVWGTAQKMMNKIPGGRLLTSPYFWSYLFYGSLAYSLVRGY